jgi:hypothetical protein
MCEIVRGGVRLEQRRGHHVHARIGALGREDGGGQQLERIAMIEFALRDRKLLRQAFRHNFRATSSRTRFAHRGEASHTGTLTVC